MGIKKQLEWLDGILECLAPHLHDFMHAEGPETADSCLFFAYRWFLVLFRREFTVDVCSVEAIWEVHNYAPTH